MKPIINIFPNKASYFADGVVAWWGMLPLSSRFQKKNAMAKSHMGVSKNNDTPKWMVYKGTPY